MGPRFAVRGYVKYAINVSFKFLMIDPSHSIV
jgi:hypothetical protein